MVLQQFIQLVPNFVLSFHLREIDIQFSVLLHRSHSFNNRSSSAATLQGLRPVKRAATIASCGFFPVCLTAAISTLRENPRPATSQAARTCPVRPIPPEHRDKFWNLIQCDLDLAGEH